MSQSEVRQVCKGEEVGGRWRGWQGRKEGKGDGGQRKPQGRSGPTPLPLSSRLSLSLSLTIKLKTYGILL